MVITPLNEGFSSAGYLYLQLQSCGALRCGEFIWYSNHRPQTYLFAFIGFIRCSYFVWLLYTLLKAFPDMQIGQWESATCASEADTVWRRRTPLTGKICMLYFISFKWMANICLPLPCCFCWVWNLTHGPVIVFVVSQTRRKGWHRQRLINGPWPQIFSLTLAPKALNVSCSEMKATL